MNNQRVSIIIPVYNSEAYLAHCLDSILAQSYHNFEILLVDDGSSDSSSGICDEYARKDRRIRVFHTKNCGVSHARNIGLEYACGDYICFCDSDDWVDNDWLKVFSQYFFYDIIIQGFYVVKFRGNEEDIKIQQTFFIGKGRADFDKLFTLIYKSNNIGFLWCRMFKRNIIEKYHIRFNLNYSFQEDEVFVFQYLQYCENFVLLNDACYHYYIPNWSKKYKKIDIHSRISALIDVIKCKRRIVGSYENSLVKSDLNSLASCSVRLFSFSEFRRLLLFFNTCLLEIKDYSMFNQKTKILCKYPISLFIFYRFYFMFYQLYRSCISCIGNLKQY